MSPDQTRPFVFIIGAPRSGTYLLLTRLQEKYDISFPVETHFIPLFRNYLFLWGNLQMRSNRRRLLRAIYDFLEIWTFRAEQGRDPVKIRSSSLLATEPHSDYIIENSDSYKGLILNMFECFANLKNSHNYGDKSAFYRHMDVDILKKTVGNVKVIHICRDGRDVSLSWRKIFTGPLSLIECARLWNEHVKNKSLWGMQNPDDYLELKYEDFVLDPDKELDEISKFLEVPKRKASGMGDNLAEILSEGEMHGLISGPVVKSNINKWTDEMSASEIECFEYFAGDELLKHGYPLRGQTTNVLKKIYYQVLAGTIWMRNIFSLRFWRRLLKNSLPIFIYFSSVLRLPLVKILNGRFRNT